MIYWTRETIAELAPDDATIERAEELVRPEHWDELGGEPTQVWGSCPGSKKGQSYRVTVYRDSGHCRCSCPSRKKPCKHAVALMLLLVEQPEALGLARPAPVESVPLDEALSRASDALGARDLPGTLGALLDGWRGVPALELAELIDLLDAAITEERASPLLKLKRTKLQPQWMKVAQAGDPADLGALLATITVASNDDAIARISALEGWPPDPRISGRLVELLDRWEALKSDKAAPFWKAAYRLFLSIDDLRVLPKIASFDSSRRHKMGIYTFMRMEEELKEIVARLEPRDAKVSERVALTEAQREQIATLRARLMPGEGSTSKEDLASRAKELLIRIYDDPDDEQLRLVYADVLGELGDPRGELITLQFERLRKKPKPAARKREAELLKQHLSDWLGPLVPYLLKKDLQFERGFLHAATFHHDRYFDVEPVLGDRRWRTLVALRGWQPPELIFHPQMASLREVQLDDRGIKTLSAMKGTCRFTAITLVDDGEYTNALLDVAPKLPQLRSLTVEGAGISSTGVLEAFLEHALARQLHHLSLRTPLGLTRSWLERLEALPQLQRATVAQTDQECGAWRLAFSRGQDGHFDTLAATFHAGEYGSDDLPDIVGALESLADSSLAAISVTARAKPDADLLGRFTAQLQRLGAPKRKLPKSWDG